MKFSKKFIRTIIIIGVVALLTINRGARNLIIHMIEYKKQQKELNKLKHINQEIEKEIYLLENSTDYIEQCIRIELGYLKRGEVEYRFEPK